MNPASHRNSRLTLAGRCWLSGALAAVLLCSDCARKPEPQPAHVTLPPLFTDNMVLQQGTPNTLWGWRPPNRPIWARYKSLTATGRITRAGTWELVLDLAARAPDPFPDHLLIGLGKPGERLVVVLTNVVVGNVWVVGSGADRGVPLRPRNGLVWQRERIRFLLLDHLPERRGDTVSRAVGWLPCGPDELADAQVSALAFYAAFALGEGYVGMIQLQTNSLVHALLQPQPVPSPVRRDRLDQVRLGLQGAYVMASNEVWQVVQRQQDLIRAFRDKGLVTNFPPVYQYNFPTAYLREAFSPTQPPATVQAFEGAIW